MPKSNLKITYAIFGEPKADSAILKITLQNLGAEPLPLIGIHLKTKKTDVGISSAITRFSGELGPAFPFVLDPSEQTALSYLRKTVVLLLRGNGISMKHPGKIEIVFTDDKGGQHKTRLDTAGL